MAKKFSSNKSMLITCVLLIFGLIIYVNIIGESDEQIISQRVDPGGAYQWIYHGRVIEITAENSLVVEILPNILTGEGADAVQRKGADSLIVGDIVEAVYKSENEYMIKFLKSIELGDIVDITFYNRVYLAFDFSTSPIIVNCDGIAIYDEEGKNIIAELGF